MRRRLDSIPVGPGFSMYDPVYLGQTDTGEPSYATMMYRNMLVGGEPGGGKSVFLNLPTAQAALSVDTRLVLFDGKLVELGPWADLADEFVGPDIDHAITTLKRLQQVMNNRYYYLRAHKRRKITRADRLSVIVTIIDELAYYSATIGTPEQQKEFLALVRDLVARGRACGMPVIAATQRPSFDIIPTSLRDIFGFRAAFRCTTPNSSDIILGHGWAGAGYDACTIRPTQQGVCYLLSEGAYPIKMKSAFLSDADVENIVDYATWIRRDNHPSGTSAMAVAA